jgi:hypothetical protein
MRDDGMMARRHCHRNDAPASPEADGMHFASCMGRNSRGSIIILIDLLMILLFFSQRRPSSPK